MIKIKAPTFNDFMREVFRREEKLMTKKELEHFHREDETLKSANTLNKINNALGL